MMSLPPLDFCVTNMTGRSLSMLSVKAVGGAIGAHAALLEPDISAVILAKPPQSYMSAGRAAVVECPARM